MSVSTFVVANRGSRTHATAAVIVGVFVLLYGGVRVRSGRGMWLEDIGSWPQATTAHDGLVPGGTSLSGGAPRSLQVNNLFIYHLYIDRIDV